MDVTREQDEAQVEITRAAAWIAGNLEARQLFVDAGEELLRQRPHAPGFLIVSRACWHLADQWEELVLGFNLAMVDLEWPPAWCTEVETRRRGVTHNS